MKSYNRLINTEYAAAYSTAKAKTRPFSPGNYGVAVYILDLDSRFRGARYLSLTFASILLHSSWLCFDSLFQASASACAGGSALLGRVPRCALFGVGEREVIWTRNRRVSLGDGYEASAIILYGHGYGDVRQAAINGGPRRQLFLRANQFTHSKFLRQRRVQIWKVQRRH